MKPNHLIQLDPSLRDRAPHVFAEGAPTVRELNDGINEMSKAFAAFREANDKRLDDIEKNQKDVVQDEKVDRINDELTKFQAAIDDMAQRLAASQVGGAGGGQVSAEVQAHAEAFESFFRAGEGSEGSVNALAVEASMTTTADPDGGALVTESMETTIDRVLGTVSAVRGMARTMTISAASHKKPVNTGGTSSGWVGETELRAATEAAKFAALEFTPMELYAMPAATQTLLDDSAVNIEQWLADEVALEFAEQEGAAFVTGDGVNKPRGLLGYDGVVDSNWAWGKVGYVATGANGAFGANPVDNLIDLEYSLKKAFRQNARWLMNTPTVAKCRKFKDADGNYLWQPSIQAGEPSTLMGYPIEDDDNMPDVATGAMSVVFSDFQRSYLIVDRTGIRVLRDPFTQKPYVLFYTTKRVGGGIQNFQAIKTLKFSAS